MPHMDKLNRTCGFIDVEEKEKSRKFIRRYLRLDKPNGILEWFADTPSNLKENYRACGAVDLNFITQVDVALKVKFKANFCFVVNTPMRKYYFQANDESDMKEWVETLNNACKIVVSDEEEDKVNDENSTSSPKSLEDFSYKTEIVAGVVIQKKVVYDDENTPIIVKSSDSRSQSLVADSPHAIGEGSGAVKSKSHVIIKEGWAVKQGHVRKNWKRRYFILSTTGFSYYKSDHVKDPIRVVSLPEILAAKIDTTELSDHKDNLFFVATTERIFYIQADTPEDMNEWVEAFNGAVNSSRSLKHRSKGSEPGDYTTMDLGASGSTDNVPRRRKLEVSMSVASSSLRNSTQVVLAKHNLSQSTLHSPVAYYRLSSVDGGYNALASMKSRSDRERNNGRRLSQDYKRAMSSSDESGLNSSMDSLTSNLTHSKATNSSALNKKKSGGENSSSRLTLSSQNRMFDVPLIREQSSLSDVQDRRSLPSLKTASVLETSEYAHHSSASFSTPKRESVSTTLSSQSFSCLNPTNRPSQPFSLDPKVDHRAAVKPSNVKKKRNTGIFFSINNVLNKKAEKMNKASNKKKR